MNEPPGARARVALTGLTVAEYFRDQEGQDVLLFIDNIFRFTQAGSEVSFKPTCQSKENSLIIKLGSTQIVGRRSIDALSETFCIIKEATLATAEDFNLLFQVSALLGRIPSAVGYQPTLATDMGTMQERITTTRKGSITSVQVICYK